MVSAEGAQAISLGCQKVFKTDIEIPKPVRKYNDQSSEEFFTTQADDVTQITYQPDFTQPPFPADVVKELRNPYKKKFVMDINSA